MTRPSLPAWLWLVAAAGFCFSLLSAIQIRKSQAGIDDFASFYVGATLARDGHLYDLAQAAAVQRATIGIERPDLAHPRLPFYYGLLSPLARLPYRTAYWLWFAIILAAAVLFPLLYPAENRGALIVAAAVSLPLAASIAVEQDVSLVLLIFSIGMLLHARGREIAAGLVFSLLAIKIHWFLLLPIPILMRRQWRAIGGLAAGGAILLGISFTVAGRDWIPRWWRSMIADPMANFKPAIMPTLHGVVDGLPGAGVLEAVMSVAVVIAACIVARRARFEISIAAAILGGFLISRHAYVHDCAILIPALVEIVTRTGKAQASRRMKSAIHWLGITLLTPFPYFLPALLLPLKEGVTAAVLIGATLFALAATRESEQKA